MKLNRSTDRLLITGLTTGHGTRVGNINIRNTYGISVVPPLDVLLSVRRWWRTSAATAVAAAAVLERFVLRGRCRVLVLGGVELRRAFRVIAQTPTGQLVRVVRHDVVHFQTVAVVIVTASQSLKRSSKSITLIVILLNDDHWVSFCKSNRTNIML